MVLVVDEINEEGRQWNPPPKGSGRDDREECVTSPHPWRTSWQ